MSAREPTCLHDWRMEENMMGMKGAAIVNGRIAVPVDIIFTFDYNCTRQQRFQKQEPTDEKGELP